MSHAYSYGHLTYYTAWLKANYPREFYCSIISCEDDVPMQRIYMETARSKGINILPPDINESSDSFALNRDTDIVYGLSGIKGLGAAAMSQILSLRPYTSLSDFLLKMHLLGTKVNKKTLDSLIMSGALDSFGYKRSVMMRSYAKFTLDFDPKDELKKECKKDNALTDNAIQAIKEFSKKEHSYFNDPTFKEFSLLEILEAEKALIGVHISGDPMDIIVKAVKDKIYTAKEVEHITKAKGKFSGCVVSVVSSVRAITTKTGKKMAFIDVVDSEGNNFSVTVFDPVYTENISSFKAGKYLQLYIGSKPSYRNKDSIDCIVNAVIDLTVANIEAAKEEKVTNVKEAYIVHTGIPSVVRFKTIMNRIKSLALDDPYSDGSDIYIVIRNDYSGYDTLSIDSPIGISDIVFGPYHTVSIDVDKIRMLNEIPDVIINTRN